MSAEAETKVETTQEETEDKVEDLEKENDRHYEPLVKLEAVSMPTGEEDDEELYKQRCALYRFTDGEWKERGRGDVKMLKNKTSGLIRLLMRQEKTLKVVMNHFILPDVTLAPNAGSDRAWTWRTRDFAEENPSDQTFAIRFRDADIANEFKAKYDDSRASNKDSSSGSSASSESAAAPANTEAAASSESTESAAAEAPAAEAPAAAESS